MSKEKSNRGRKSKLTDAQREEIRKRLLKGEQCASIAREHGVDPKVIRRIKSESSNGSKPGTIRMPVAEIKQVAEKSVLNDLSDPEIRPLLETMGDEDRNLFYAHKNDLMEISLHLNMASKFSALNAHKLAKMAQNHLNKLEDDSKIDGETVTVLNDAARLQAESNEAAKQPMKLYEIATRQPPPPPPPNSERRIVFENAPPE